MIRSEHGQLYSCIVQAVANLSRAEKLLQLLLRNCPAYDKVDRVGGVKLLLPTRPKSWRHAQHWSRSSIERRERRRSISVIQSVRQLRVA